ncbi:hypothetical protein HMPREF1210_00154 [Paenisporosarcina sp. HGH0030]|uniref:hypothetical protein n=1 Tax=Paenisporosarcina sp. HGH0030 TaxID=1078085 RepID=UPI00034EBA74|nr:hypothetical protein [Paenisporosarcina sp. HGH0030]EPD54169.1 hypothetical protein HMPREF1210_00154 [Paenisporosarcina sp. HGH0030]
MQNINRDSVIERAFNKLNKEQVINYIKEKKVGWRINKKQKSKADLKDVFLSLKKSLSDQDIVELTEMSVMRRKRGLPAYTYKFSHLGKMKDKSIEEINKDFLKSYPGGGYEVVVMDINLIDENIHLNLTVKEYETAWKTGIQDLGTLSAVYHNKVILDEKNKVASIEAGDDNIEEIIEKFLVTRIGIPVIPYTMGIFNAHHSDSASEKTMLIFDYIFNRLPSSGLSSSFDDVKFSISNRHQSGGVKGVTIHGNDIINSDEACKYITLGNDIVSFKTTSIYNGSKVSIQFSLKGKKYDKLKIVVMDNNSDSLKQEVMEKLQTEYILLCENGVKDINKTRQKLKPIYENFIQTAS